MRVFNKLKNSTQKSSSAARVTSGVFDLYGIGGNTVVPFVNGDQNSVLVLDPGCSYTCKATWVLATSENSSYNHGGTYGFMIWVNNNGTPTITHVEPLFQSFAGLTISTTLVPNTNVHQLVFNTFAWGVPLVTNWYIRLEHVRLLRASKV